MSDSAVANIMTDLVTITITVVGFLTLWVKLRYGIRKTESVESKLDDNTAMTASIQRQTNGVLDTRLSQLDDHGTRIAALEAKMEAMKAALDGLGHNLDSTRHELRGQLQTITSGLQLLSIRPPTTEGKTE